MLDARTADAAAESLGLDLRRLELCALCLYGVSSALGSGDERQVRSALRFFAPLLWDEGLDEPLRAALADACRRGVTGAAAAAADVERYGPASRVVKAVVRRLAEQQLRQLRAFERLPPPPPPSLAAEN